jgi:hypothetical protein
MQKQPPQTFQDRAMAALKRDPKKTSLMLGLLAVMVMLMVRMFSAGPAAATASFIRRQVAGMSSDQPTQTPRALIPSPVLNWISQPRRVVERNLFAVKTDYYAKAGAAGWDSSADPAKSDEEGTDQNRQRQILMENLQTQAGKLKLQTTVMGPNPIAVINGELVKEGDTIAGFKVVKIEPRRMTIEQESMVLEIEMP